MIGGGGVYGNHLRSYSVSVLALSNIYHASQIECAYGPHVLHALCSRPTFETAFRHGFGGDPLLSAGGGWVGGSERRSFRWE